MLSIFNIHQPNKFIEIMFVSFFQFVLFYNIYIFILWCDHQNDELYTFKIYLFEYKQRPASLKSMAEIIYHLSCDLLWINVHVCLFCKWLICDFLFGWIKNCMIGFRKRFFLVRFNQSPIRIHIQKEQHANENEYFFG